MFNVTPRVVYMADGNGHVFKGSVREAIFSMDYNSSMTLQIECDGVTIRAVNPMRDMVSKDIDIDVFQALLEDGYGAGDSEVQEKVAEEAT